MGGFSIAMKKCRKYWCIENDHNGNCTNAWCNSNTTHYCGDCGAEVSVDTAMDSRKTGNYAKHNGVVTCEYRNVLK